MCGAVLNEKDECLQRRTEVGRVAPHAPQSGMEVVALKQ